jgi:zeaxanthin glucosyltransferase
MKKVLIIQFPAISHLNASFKIAKILQQQQYEIYYYINNKVAAHVAEQQFQVVSSFNAPIGEDYDRAAIKLHNIKYPYFDRLRDKVMKLFIDNRRNELLNVVGIIAPDIIIADTYFGTDFALLYPVLKEKGIRYFHIETMLSCIEQKGIPYFDSAASPNDMWRIRKEHLRRKWRRSFLRLYRRFLYLGFDNISWLKREAKLVNLPPKYVINLKNYCDIAFTGIPSLLIAPIELEYFHKPASEHDYYLGFFMDGKTDAKELEEGQLKVIVESGKRIIYISFGTVFGEIRVNDIIAFMKKVNAVVGQMDNVAVIFTLSNVKWSADELAALTNVYIFNFVPQVSLLPFCSLFITHGGLNSIRESIKECVPMLVVPLEIDQIGNAKKVEYKGLGLMGDIKTITQDELRRKVSELIGNQQVKDAIKTMRDEIIAAYDPERTLMEIIQKQGLVE